MPFLVLQHGVDKSKMFPNFNLEIGDDISDEEILGCVETIEKEKESVTSPPECRPQTLKKLAKCLRTLFHRKKKDGGCTFYHNTLQAKLSQLGI